MGRGTLVQALGSPEVKGWLRLLIQEAVDDQLEAVGSAVAVVSSERLVEMQRTGQVPAAPVVETVPQRPWWEGRGGSGTPPASTDRARLQEAVRDGEFSAHRLMESLMPNGRARAAVRAELDATHEERLRAREPVRQMQRLPGGRLVEAAVEPDALAESGRAGWRQQMRARGLDDAAIRTLGCPLPDRTRALQEAARDGRVGLGSAA
jgi:hypothetical protein